MNFRYGCAGATAGVLAAAAFCVVAASPLAAQRTVDERFAVEPDVYVRVHSMAGTVRVSAWEHDSLAVEGVVFETARERFHLGRGASNVKLGFWDAEATEARPSEIHVRVPAGAHVWIKTASADITVTGVQGGLDLYSLTGRIGVSGSPREVFAESMGGAIDLAADTRTARATTASGDITVRGAIADASARTVSGSLTVQGGRFERGRFESVEGPIRYFGEVGRGSWLDFVNHSGAVEFHLPRDAAADFLISTFEGSLDNRLGVRVREGGTKLRGRESTLEVGGGGGHVTVRSFKGAVVLGWKG